MALRKAHRLFNIPKISAQTLTNCQISSSSSLQTRIPPNFPNKSSISPEIFHRFVHRRVTLHPVRSPELRSLPTGENLTEKVRDTGIARDRIRLEGLAPPDPKAPASCWKDGITVEDARKLLKLTQLEMVKSRLREIEESAISYSEFVRVCGEGLSDPDEGPMLAKTLDESGSVVVLGNVVFLSIEQLTKALQGLIPLPGSATTSDDPRVKEHEKMKKQKASMDKKAEFMVRRELWAGLGFLILQTAGFIRLTFWELSWDVMEPICFYVTSFYFMAGYAFFLRTAKEPSFDGFFQSRFSAKQKKLIKINNFDVRRYNELHKICYPR